MFKRSLLALLVPWLSISVLSGQSYFKPGYIISHEMDTTYGLIDFRGGDFNYASCVFISDKGEDPQILYPGSIYGYRFTDGNYYISKRVDTEKGPQDRFMEVLLSGKITLYHWRVSQKDYNFYIETRNGEMLRLYEKESVVSSRESGQAIRRMKYYVGALGYAMSDAPVLYGLIERVSLQQRDLVMLLEKYHNTVCDEMDCITYIKSFPTLKIRFAPFVSWQMEWLNINGPNDYASLKYKAAYYPSAGLSLVAFMSGSGERFSLRTDISLGSRYFYGFGVEEAYQATLYREAHLKHTVLTGDMKVNYTAPQGRIRPSYSGGISLQKNFAASHRIDMDIMTASIIEPMTFYTDAWGGLWLGFNAGAGFETNLLPKVNTYFQIQYRNLFYFEDSSVITSIGLTAGLKF
ncbi:MAG: hypothetical protein RBT50_01505 [Bacteroidales bacterium]|jgi:hypothetical protein|nr:hypothetical protein [Bacteroidales bacterium]